MAQDDLGAQLRIQREINKLLSTREKILKRNARLSDKMCETLESCQENMRRGSECFW